MDKTIGIAEAQENLKRIVDEVAQERAAYVLTRDNRPAVVLIPYEEYLRFRSREEIKARFDRAWAELGVRNAGFSKEEIEADLRLESQRARARALVGQAKADVAREALSLNPEDAWAQYDAAADALRKALRASRNSRRNR